MNKICVGFNNSLSTECLAELFLINLHMEFVTRWRIANEFDRKLICESSLFSNILIPRHLPLNSHFTE